MTMNYKCPHCDSTGPFQRTQETIFARWQHIDGNGIPQSEKYKEKEDKDEMLCEACDFEADIHEFEHHA